MTVKKAAGIILIVILFISGISGGYYYFSTIFPKEKAPEGEAARSTGEYFVLRLYYPVDNQIQVEERRPSRTQGHMAIAEAAIGEYLKGPTGDKPSAMPENARLLGVYKGADRILYVDISGEFRRNFQGDAYTEFLLLKSLYESIISNVEDIQDVKVLIEGKEVETLGGHLYLSSPLKDIVTYGY